MHLGYEGETSTGWTAVFPTGSWEETWAKHGGVDPVAAMWRRKQARDCERLTQNRGWIMQPDGSCIPPFDDQAAMRRARRGIRKAARRVKSMGEDLDGLSGHMADVGEGVDGLGFFGSNTIDTVVGYSALGAVAGYFLGKKAGVGAALGAALGIAKVSL